MPKPFLSAILLSNLWAFAAFAGNPAQGCAEAAAEPLSRSVASLASLGQGVSAELKNSPDGRVEELLKMGSALSGPNCWNAATYASGVYPYLLLTTDLQAQLIFERSCKVLPGSPADAPAGSVVRMGNGREEVHAFLSLGAGKFFQKRDNSAAGAYEVVSYAEIEKIYGRDRYCEAGKKCDWYVQNLSCTPGHAFADLKRAPPGYRDLLKLTSRLATGGSAELARNAAELKSAIERIASPGELSRLQSYLKKADANSAATIFDLSQTIRLLSNDLEGRLPAGEAQALRKAFDRVLWSLTEAYLERKPLSNADISVAYDFVYGSSAAGADSTRLRDKVATLMVRRLPGRAMALTSATGLLSNPSIAYADAGKTAAEAVALAKGGDPQLTSTLATFFLYSASSFPNRGQLLKTFVQEIPLDGNYALASDLIEAVLKNELSPQEKTALAKRVLDSLTGAPVEALRSRYAAELTTLAPSAPKSTGR